MPNIYFDILQSVNSFKNRMADSKGEQVALPTADDLMMTPAYIEKHKKQDDSILERKAKKEASDAKQKSFLTELEAQFSKRVLEAYGESVKYIAENGVDSAQLKLPDTEFNINGVRVGADVALYGFRAKDENGKFLKFDQRDISSYNRFNMQIPFKAVQEMLATKYKIVMRNESNPKRSHNTYIRIYVKKIPAKLQQKLWHNPDDFSEVVRNAVA